MLWHSIYFSDEKVCGSDWKKRKIWISERLDSVSSGYGDRDHIRMFYHSMADQVGIEMVFVNQDLVVDIK